MKTIMKYFPQLTERQQEQLMALDKLYHEWNERINVVSRRDIDNLYEHHVLHSMAIAKAVSFRPGASVLDFGTGGGFPGVPLAILFPECRFTLIDGTGKKIRVAQEVVQAIGLDNCTPLHRRGEEEKGDYNYVVSRAVMPMPDLLRIVRKNVPATKPDGPRNAVICLKGGNLDEELRPLRNKVQLAEISTWFSEPWFNDKYVVYLPI